MARQLREGKRVRTPLFIEAPLGMGVPIAGCGPKRDAYTGDEVPGVQRSPGEPPRDVPIPQQLGAVSPGDGNVNREANLARHLTGPDLQSEDRPSPPTTPTGTGSTEHGRGLSLPRAISVADGTLPSAAVWRWRCETGSPPRRPGVLDALRAPS